MKMKCQDVNVLCQGSTYTCALVIKSDFQKYLLSIYHLPTTVPGAEYASVNKWRKLSLMEFTL